MTELISIDAEEQLRLDGYKSFCKMVSREVLATMGALYKGYSAASFYDLALYHLKVDRATDILFKHGYASNLRGGIWRFRYYHDLKDCHHTTCAPYALHNDYERAVNLHKAMLTKTLREISSQCLNFNYKKNK